MALLRKTLACAFIFVYLCAMGYFFGRHLIGDTGRSQWAYLWTWDMFPNYPSFSVRRLAVAETKSGRHLRIFPTPRQSFQRGGSGDYSRFDLPRNDKTFREAVERVLTAQTGDTDDPITYVFLIESFWPVRFNLPDDLFRQSHGAENTHEKYWRIIDESPVNAARETRWVNEP